LSATKRNELNKKIFLLNLQNNLTTIFWCGLYQKAGGGGDGHKNGGLYTACEHHAHQPTHAHATGERRVGQRSSGKIRQKIWQKSAKIIPRKIRIIG
jgi:hypothetical protein